jgi:DNA-binding transcriptional regulator YiaG
VLSSNRHQTDTKNIFSQFRGAEFVHAVEYQPAPTVTPQELIRVRKDLKLSRALFAVYLRTNVRTLENWEQGRAKPKCASRAADQSGQASSGYSRKARHNLVADSSVVQSVVVIDTHSDLE